MSSENSNRIAKNTFVLYVQMVAAMLIGLYTSRVILNVLGVEDFGIYNAIGGVVALFGILNSAMSSSTSRFITFELGSGKLDKLKSVFSTSLLIHIGLAILVCVVTLPVGLWFMRTHMQIPEPRMDAAVWVFFSVVAATFFSILSVPYNAAMIAHERMSNFAYFSILDLSLKLVIVLILPFVPFDKLKTYAVLLVLVRVIMQFIYWIYCYRSFPEVRVGLRWNQTLFKEMTSFAGWSLFGDSAFLMYTQGLNVLLNIFFGAPVNAARGIAVQVQGVLMRFTSGFQTALNPQITKSYAGGDLKYMHRLIFSSSKFSFFIVLMLSIPVFLEAESLLTWWLRIVPDHTVSFVRILICISLIDCLANPLVFAAKATGKIKRYQILLGSLLLLIVPVSYVFLQLGYPPEVVFKVHLGIAILGQYVRIHLLSSMIQFSMKDYLLKIVMNCLFVLALALVAPMIMHYVFNVPLIRLIMVSASSLISVTTLTYFLALDIQERSFINQLVRARVQRLDWRFNR